MANDKNRRNHEEDGGGGGEGEITLPNLPQEIHTEILLRLPVKSLCKFRCVCKSWLSLISSSEFAKSHVNLALQNQTRSRRVIFSYFNLLSVEYESLANDDENNGVVVPIKEHDYAFKNIPNDWFQDDEDNPDFENVDRICFRNWVEIWGSCDGLLCILICMSPYEDALFLLNPSTGESKKILDKDTNWPSMFGFGYDSINDDYKVLQIDFGSYVTLYSLKNDSWKKMGLFPYHGDIYDSWVFLFGSFHWVVIDRKEQISKYAISAFDVARERFWEMEAPDIDTSCGLVTGIFNGCLCILYSWKGMHDDFWVMREYGVTESWTRVTISLSYVHMKPLGLAKNGEAVLQVDGRLVLCNLENNTYKEIGVTGIPTGDKVCAETYVESLVSINCYCRRNGREIQMQN